MENLNEKSPTDDLGHSQAIKAALHYKIGQITEEVGAEYGLTFDRPVIATFAEFINRQIEIYAIDLEAFAKHGRRTTINCEDVKLLVRRNSKLKETIKEISDLLEPSGSGLPKKRKRDAAKQETELEVREDN